MSVDIGVLAIPCGESGSRHPNDKVHCTENNDKFNKKVVLLIHEQSKL
jgi:hypothetical protein